MKVSRQLDVFIAGCGMVGAAVACALGRQGLRVAVMDRCIPTPFESNQPPDLRVSALGEASINILQNLGAWSYIEAMRVCPYREMAVWEKLRGSPVVGKKPLNRVAFRAKDIRREQLGFIVENRVVQLGLQRVLEDIENVEQIVPASLRTVSFSNNTPEIILNDGRSFSATLLVGADGAFSAVRQMADIGLDVSEYEQQCLVATVEIDGGRSDITWQAFTPTGPEALLPLPDANDKNYASIVWYNKPETVTRLMALSDEAFLEEVRSSFPDDLPSLVRLHERGYFPLARRHAQNYFLQGVVLVGDSAHTINPLAGQGVNLGFQDVAWLTEVIGEAFRTGESIGDPDVLARYERVRRKQNTLMMSAMDGFYHAFSNDNSTLKLFRNLGLGAIGRSRYALRTVMKYASGSWGKQPVLARRPV